MRIPSNLHPTPARRDILAAELRSVGIAICPLASITAAVVAVMGLLLVAYELRTRDDIDVVPDLGLLVTLFAPVFPVFVWKGEYRFRHSYLASMPVDRTYHVLVKMAAGWAWLMVSTAVYVLFMLALAVITGGQIGVDEMRVLASDVPSGTVPVDLEALARRWTTSTWEWAVFFTGPTVAYLLGSAVVLVGSRTRRWLAGIAILVFFLLVLDDEGMDLGRLATRIEWVLVRIVASRYGIMTLLAVTDANPLTNAAGEEIGIVWSDPPTLTAWTIATLLWTGLAAGSLLAVVRRGRKD